MDVSHKGQNNWMQVVYDDEESGLWWKWMYEKKADTKMEIQFSVCVCVMFKCECACVICVHVWACVRECLSVGECVCVWKWEREGGVIRGGLKNHFRRDLDAISSNLLQSRKNKMSTFPLKNESFISEDEFSCIRATPGARVRPKNPSRSWDVQVADMFR